MVVGQEDASPEVQSQQERAGASKRVLVTGAGGFIGRNLCPVLESSGWHVRRITRRKASEHAMALEMGVDTDWSQALEGIDAVVHLAARVHVLREQASEPGERFRLVNVAATRQLAMQAAIAGVKRLVFISTIGVHGVKTEEEGFRETDVPNPLNHYALSKLEAEQALQEVARETGLEVVVIRPPLVYGPGVKANFYMLLRLVQTGLPLPMGSIRNKRDMIYVGNLSDAILQCLSHPAASGETFLVSDGKPVSTPELVRHIASGMGRNARLFPVPVKLLRFGGWVLGRCDMVHRLVSSLEVNHAHICNKLDWKPPYTFDDGICATVAWFMKETQHR